MRETVKGRSSLPDVFCIEGVLRNFAKFTGKCLRQSLFFNKIAGLRPAALLKKALTQVFSCEFYEIFKNSFFVEHLRWLLLKREGWFHKEVLPSKFKKIIADFQRYVTTEMSKQTFQVQVIIWIWNNCCHWDPIRISEKCFVMCNLNVDILNVCLKVISNEPIERKNLRFILGKITEAATKCVL